MPEIVSGADYATFINTFRCEPSNQDEAVQLNIDIVDPLALPREADAWPRRVNDRARHSA
jgi:hypothetical protein